MDNCIQPSHILCVYVLVDSFSTVVVLGSMENLFFFRLHKYRMRRFIRLYALKNVKTLIFIGCHQNDSNICIVWIATHTKKEPGYRPFSFWHTQLLYVCTTFWLTKLLVRISFNLQHYICVYMSIHIFHVRPNYNNLFFYSFNRTKWNEE